MPRAANGNNAWKSCVTTIDLLSAIIRAFYFGRRGNTVITPDILCGRWSTLRKELDPNGGRAVMGTRGDSNDSANTALTPIAEYYGVMIGQDRRTDALAGPTAMFRAYSAERRDRAPLIETEDFRDEAARRFWDDFSPPHFGFKKGPNDTTPTLGIRNILSRRRRALPRLSCQLHFQFQSRAL